jgi:hypothetical protein
MSSTNTMTDSPNNRMSYANTRMANYMEPRTARGLGVLALLVVIVAVVWYSRSGQNDDAHCGRPVVGHPRKVYDARCTTCGGRRNACACVDTDGYHSDSSSESDHSHHHH